MLPPPKELSHLIATSKKSAMAKWPNRQMSSAHSSHFPTISEQLKPAKFNWTYTALRIWKFLYSINYDFPTVIQRIAKIWFRDAKSRFRLLRPSRPVWHSLLKKSNPMKKTAYNWDSLKITLKRIIWSNKCNIFDINVTHITL